MSAPLAFSSEFASIETVQFHVTQVFIMCGRFTLTSDRETIEDLLPELAIDGPLHPRYNIAPSQPVATILNDGKRALTYSQWGLIPSWAKDPSIGNRMINARSETLAEKPAYRAPFKRKRCVIVADGFFEWQKVPGSASKTPVYFRFTNRRPFLFAGLWDQWHDADGGELLTSTIITTKANKLIASVHDRMPVILDKASIDAWLDPLEKKPESLKPLLRPADASGMESFSVSKIVNNPRNDSEACIQPVEEQAPLL